VLLSTPRSSAARERHAPANNELNVHLPDTGLLVARMSLAAADS
jgi:hypothetical protein